MYWRAETVRLFDRDLQVIIEQEDAEFFEYARQTARDEKKPKPALIPADLLDAAPRNVAMTFLSNAALEFYREKAGIQPDVQTPEFEAQLERSGFLTDEDGKHKPTGHGLLLFGKTPEATFKQAPLFARIEFPDGTTERKEFAGPLVLIPDAVETWLRPKLPNVLDRGSMQRREVSSLPFEVLREAIVNALVHRDYDIAGANIQLVVTPDTVRISSPGGPTPPLTLEQLQRFTAPTISRNPELHYAFVESGLAEKMGFGLPSLRDRANQLGLPRPKYEFDGVNLALTIYLHSHAAVAGLDPDTLNGLSTSEREGWQWMSRQGWIRSADYARQMKIDTRTARRHLQRFLELDLIVQKGATRGTRYKPKDT